MDDSTLVLGILLGILIGAGLVLLAAKPAGSSQAMLENVEEIVWVDWRGRERRMTIHREVR
jgi:hypothetical protein